MNTTAQLNNGPSSKFVHNILVYLCTQIGAIIKKMYNKFEYW